MELFEQQYFTEEGHEKDYPNLNFSLLNSCTPQTAGPKFKGNY